MIIGTAGHIDHGKTTLVKALTGVDCDRLKEEKARGITLDLGYAYTSTLGFVDVPGHEKLIHNMLAGATGIDFALLVVAADDGPMPQTREHLQLIELLGIRRGAVALTKVDTVSPEQVAAAKEAIRGLLTGTGLESSPVFEVSAPTGAGVEALKAYLDIQAANWCERTSSGHFRLAIDRCFSLSGVGTVVTGTAFAGHVAIGDSLTLLPSNKTVRVRGLRVHDQPAEAGKAGQRIALALAGVEKSEVQRGQWVVASTINVPLRGFDAQLRVLGDQPPLKHGAQVHLHLGTADVLARVALLETDEIKPGDSGFAHLKLEQPLGAMNGDCFVLRDASAQNTIAGGMVLDIFPPGRRKRSPARLDILRALQQSDPAIALAVYAQQQVSGVDLNAYAINRNLCPEPLQEIVAALGLKVVGSIGFSVEAWQLLRAKTLAALESEHQRAPDMQGVERDRLRRLTLPTLDRRVFDEVLAGLLGEGAICQKHAWLHLPSHQRQLSESDQQLWKAIAPVLDAAPFGPPRVRDVAKETGLAEDHLRQSLKRIARFGEAFPVAHDHFFTASAVRQLAVTIAELSAQQGAVKAAMLRDQIGGGRKVAIHILEFFDRIGYTRRVRDSHVLRGSPEQFGA